jgi:hypothetical protein
MGREERHRVGSNRIQEAKEIELYHRVRVPFARGRSGLSLQAGTHHMHRPEDLVILTRTYLSTILGEAGFDGIDAKLAENGMLKVIGISFGWSLGN